MDRKDLLIGIDVGGTFTDAIVFDALAKRFLAAFKIPSTPGDPGQAVVSALRKIAESVDVKGAVVFHGSAVGTNTLIDRKGAKTALMSTKGFSGPYKRNSTSNCPLGFVGTQFASLPAGAFGPK